MKILLNLYCVPGLINAISAIYDHLFNWCINLLPADQIDLKIICSDSVIQDDEASKGLLKQYNPIVLTQQDFDYIFSDSHLSVIQKMSIFALNKLNPFQQKRLDEFLSKNLKDWEPDIILSWAWQSSKPFAHLYPHALCLNQDNALFSRPPYKRSLCYDVFHNFCIFPNYFIKNVHKFKISKYQNLKVEEFKFMLREMIEKTSPVSERIKKEKARFRKTLLLPLVNESFNTYLQEKYTSNYDFLEYVFQNIPSDIGIFVTEPDQGEFLKGKTLEHFQQYPNFIFLSETNVKNGFSANSLHYLYHVDGILGTPSKTALNGLIYDKPVISLDRNFHDWMVDSKDITKVDKILSKKYKNKNNLLYWYLTHYAVFEKNYYTKGWLFDYLNNKLNIFRKQGITFDLYNKINDFNDISMYILSSVAEHYKIEFNEVELELEKFGIKFKKSLKFGYYVSRILSHLTFGEKGKYYQQEKAHYRQLLK